MDRLTTSPRHAATTPTLGLAQLPKAELQHILHYLPIKGTRDVLRLVSKAQLASTDYLRNGGLVQNRIRAVFAPATEQRAASRLPGLIDDCMNPAFPAEMQHSLVLELIGLLPQLPGTEHAEALRFVLDRCGMMEGDTVRRDWMSRCIHAYQRRTEQAPHLKKFAPANDEEACIAAAYFTEIDPGTRPASEVIAHLDNLLAAMDWADAISDREDSEAALIDLCIHSAETFALLNDPPALLRKDPAWNALPALKASFAQKALLLVPVTSPGCQGNLIAVALHLSEPHSAMRRQAEADGRNLMALVPGARLQANAGWLADKLFHGDVFNELAARVESWPEPKARLAMLKELAIVAWEKGAMHRMEKLCAAVCKLEPPDPAKLKTLMEANLDKDIFTRLDISTRDVIPYLMCVPPGLSRVRALDTLSLFLLNLPRSDLKLKTQLRFNLLFHYGISANLKLMQTYINGSTGELDQAANALMSAWFGNAADPSTPLMPETFSYPAVDAMLDRLKELFPPLAKPGL